MVWIVLHSWEAYSSCTKRIRSEGIRKASSNERWGKPLLSSVRPSAEILSPPLADRKCLAITGPSRPSRMLMPRANPTDAGYRIIIARIQDDNQWECLVSIKGVLKFPHTRREEPNISWVVLGIGLYNRTPPELPRESPTCEDRATMVSRTTYPVCTEISAILNASLWQYSNILHWLGFLYTKQRA